MTLPAAEVERARTALREAIDDLCSIEHHKIETDDGDVRHATTPPLLDQIEAEIAGNSQNAGGVSWLQSKPPAWLDAMALLAEIDDIVGPPRSDDDGRSERVRDWGAAVASAEPESMVAASEKATRWVVSCRTLLDPPPKMALRGQACPRCGTSKVWDRHDVGAGEHHAKPALEIDQTRGCCVCRACGASWAPETFELLAEVLRQQQAETLAASGFDPTVRARTPEEKWDRRRV